MNKTSSLLSIFFSLLILLSCVDDGSDNSVSTPSVIKNLKVYDVSNKGNSSDIFIKFNIPENRPLSIVKLFMVQTSEDTFNPATLSSVKNILSSVDLDGEGNGFYEHLVEKELLDINNNPIMIDVPYHLYIVPITKNETIVGPERVEVTLTNENPVVGPYRGVWSDNVDGSLAVSTHINFDPNTGIYSGPFFYTNIFEPCCGGNDDGEISFSLGLNMGDSLSNFSYRQLLNIFRGSDNCEGLYQGTGRRSNFIRIEIEYLGIDCIAAHRGTLIFEKQ